MSRFRLPKACKRHTSFFSVFKSIILHVCIHGPDPYLLSSQSLQCMINGLYTPVNMQPSQARTLKAVGPINLP